jgi:hypothetical protein
MRKNYFVKLVNYMKNVYHIDQGINKLKDGRVNPKYKTKQVILPLLLGLLLRIKSMNELKFMFSENEFINIMARKTKLPRMTLPPKTLPLSMLANRQNDRKANIPVGQVTGGRSRIFQIHGFNWRYV